MLRNILFTLSIITLFSCSPKKTKTSSEEEVVVKEEEKIDFKNTQIKLAARHTDKSGNVDVIDVYRGNVHYIIFKYNTYEIEVVNYTSDSIEYEIVK